MDEHLSIFEAGHPIGLDNLLVRSDYISYITRRMTLGWNSAVGGFSIMSTR